MHNYSSTSSLMAPLCDVSYDESCFSFGASISYPMYVFAMVNVTYMALAASLTLILNCLLISAILHSPTLNTRPNAYLVSLCGNGILLALCMILDIITTLQQHVRNRISWLVSFQNSGIYCCLMNYWLNFMVIGYYRCTVLENPYVSANLKRRLIYKSLLASWIATISLTAMFGVIHILLRGDAICIQLTSHQLLLFNVYEVWHNYLSNRTASHYVLLVFVITLMVLAVAAGVVIMTYCAVLKRHKFIHCSKRNKIIPASDSAPDSSLESESTVVSSMPVPKWLMMKSTDSRSTQAYMIRQSATDQQDVTQSNMSESYRQQTQCSSQNIYNENSTFTDIIARSDYMLKPQSEPDDPQQSLDMRLSPSKLSNATKNMLVMMSMFVIFSTVMFVCGIPYLLTAMPCQHRTVLVMISRSVFYVNGYVYSCWYLLFTRKVRNVVSRAIQQCHW